ncbi:MAG: hypothetical protein Kow0029_00350 [Candidatus Rifleibacteriota bacterium]
MELRKTFELPLLASSALLISVVIRFQIVSADDIMYCNLFKSCTANPIKTGTKIKVENCFELFAEVAQA